MLIVDTYNVLHVTGVLPPHLADIEIDGLIQLITQSRYRDEQIELVCDGVQTSVIAATTGLRRIQPRYAGPGATADDLIAEMVAAAPRPRQITVVTSDREVQRAARKRRCRIMESATFLSQLLQDASTPRSETVRRPVGGLTDSQVNEWRDIFGISDTEQDLESADASDQRAGASPRPATHDPPVTDDDLTDSKCNSSEEATNRSAAEDKSSRKRSNTKRRRRPARKDVTDNPAVFPPDILAQARRIADQNTDTDDSSG